LDAATASIAGGLFEYVFSLKVASRDKNDAVDEGRYSEALEKMRLSMSESEREAWRVLVQCVRGWPQDVASSIGQPISSWEVS